MSKTMDQLSKEIKGVGVRLQYEKNITEQVNKCERLIEDIRMSIGQYDSYAADADDYSQKTMLNSLLKAQGLLNQALKALNQ